MSTLIVTTLWVLTTALVTLDTPEMEQHAQVNIFFFSGFRLGMIYINLCMKTFKKNTRLPSHILTNIDIQDAKSCQIERPTLRKIVV